MMETHAYDLNRLVQFTQNNKARDRQALLLLAKAAERAERYEDQIRFICEIIKNCAAGEELMLEERQLLWSGYKQLMSALRLAIRVASKYDVENPLVSQYTEILEDYKVYLENEMSCTVGELVALLENTLIKNTGSNEARAFYLKICADYFRYLAEINPVCGYEKRVVDLYGHAWKIASTSLPVNHPTRLGIALNYSVCLYEMFSDRKGAADLAKSTFDLAIRKLDELDEQSYKDSTLIMQLIRDNLTLWASAGAQLQK